MIDWHSLDLVGAGVMKKLEAEEAPYIIRSYQIAPVCDALSSRDFPKAIHPIIKDRVHTLGQGLETRQNLLPGKIQP